MNSIYLAIKPTATLPPKTKKKKINKNHMVFQVLKKCLNIYQFKMYITVFNSIVQLSSDFGSRLVSFNPRGYINR